MKELLLGNAALARGLYEAGVVFVSSYPGTPSTEVTEAAAKYPEIYCEWAPNEKVAMESVFGASIAGGRAFCGMKHVGLNVAADPLFTLSYTGVRAGIVICVADDPGMHSSQNEQDSRHYAMAAKVPMLEPSDSQETLDFTKRAFEISEEFDTPVIIKMCTRISHSQSVCELGERVEYKGPGYEKDIAKYVMMPGNAKKRHPFVEDRTKRLADYAESSGINRMEMGDKGLGIITSSASYQYVREALGEDVSVLKLGMAYPLPEKMIRDFASKVDRLVVIEELDPFFEMAIKAMGIPVEGKELFPICGEFSQNLIRSVFNRPVEEGESIEDEIPVRPPVMCAGCPHRAMFHTLKKNKCIVLGDIGCYTLGAVPPLSCVDTTLCMGASVSSVHGFVKTSEMAGENEAASRAVAVIGDSTFMHSGVTSLANIAYNQSASTVVILDNSITGMTGHQHNPTTGYNIKGDPAGKIDLEALCRSMGFSRVRVCDPNDLSAMDKIVKEEIASKEPSVIISRRPCALLKYVKHNPPLSVDKDKCVGCTACMKIGCPAISMVEGKAQVDKTLCVGCDVCVQLCHSDAFVKEGR